MNIEKGPIFVNAADGDKGYTIVTKLLEIPKRHSLAPQPIYAGISDVHTLSAEKMKAEGAHLCLLNVLEDYQSVVDALKLVTKLILVIDPINKRITKSNIYDYGKLMIDAAKDAGISHIIFLTPFSTQLSSPVTSYQSQFTKIQSYLYSQFDNAKITLVCYPGILHQQLLVFKDYIQEHGNFPLPEEFLEKSIESSNLEDVATAASYIAHSPTSRFSGKTYKLTGPQLMTLQEVSFYVLRGLGLDSSRVDYIDVQRLRGILTQSLQYQDHADFLLEIWGLQQPIRGCRLEGTRDMEVLIGQSGKMLSEFFQDHGVNDTFFLASTLKVSF